MATAINDGESVRLTEAGVVHTLEKGGSIRIESSGNDIIFYQNGKQFQRLAYTAFTTPTFTSAEDGRTQIEAMLAAASGASNPAKAEDSVHTSGDVGDFVLAVRQDPTAAGVPSAALAGDGDYIPLVVDNLGRVYVAPHALLASEVQMGFVSNSGNVVTPSITVDTAIYATGDVLFIATEIANFFRTTAGRALIHSIEVLDVDEEAAAFDLIFCESSQNFGALNAAANLTDPTGMPILGHVSISTGDYIDIGGQRLATLTTVGLEVQAAAGQTSLWINGIVRATPTYTAGTDLRLKIGYIYM